MVIAINESKPAPLSAPTTVNAVFLDSPLTLDICSILRISPPIADGRNIDPYMDNTYPLDASISDNSPNSLNVKEARKPPAKGLKKLINTIRKMPMGRIAIIKSVN